MHPARATRPESSARSRASVDAPERKHSTRGTRRVQLLQAPSHARVKPQQTRRALVLVSFERSQRCCSAPVVSYRRPRQPDARTRCPHAFRRLCSLRASAQDSGSSRLGKAARRRERAHGRSCDVRVALSRAVGTRRRRPLMRRLVLGGVVPHFRRKSKEEADPPHG